MIFYYLRLILHKKVYYLNKKKGFHLICLFEINKSTILVFPWEAILQASLKNLRIIFHSQNNSTLDKLVNCSLDSKNLLLHQVWVLRKDCRRKNLKLLRKFNPTTFDMFIRNQTELN